jgi:hypothetical protein
MQKAYLTSTYLGPVEYYAKLYHYPKVMMEAHDNYLKQTYRNRLFIEGANGTQVLSIPIEKDPGKVPTRDVRLSEHGNWRHQHWYAIRSTYNNTPFFEFYEDDFAPFFEQRHEFLFDFCEGLRRLVCELIGFNPDVELTSEYRPTEQIEAAGDRDFRELIHPKRDCATADPEFRIVPYYQLFAQKHGFTPNLSIIDLLFNMGPESLLVLRDSIAR